MGKGVPNTNNCLFNFLNNKAQLHDIDLIFSLFKKKIICRFNWLKIQTYVSIVLIILLIEKKIVL